MKNKCQLFPGINFAVIYMVAAALLAVWVGVHIRFKNENKIIENNLPVLAAQADAARQQVTTRLEKFSDSDVHRADLRITLANLNTAADMLKALSPKSPELISKMRLAWETLDGVRESLSILDQERADSYAIMLDVREQFCRVGQAEEVMDFRFISTDALIVADAIYAATASRVEVLRQHYEESSGSNYAYDSIGAAQKARELKILAANINDARHRIDVDLEIKSILPSDSRDDVDRANAVGRALAECADEVAKHAAAEAEVAMQNAEPALSSSLYQEAASRMIGAKEALIVNAATEAQLSARIKTYQELALRADEISADNIIARMNRGFDRIDALFPRSK